MQSVNHIIYYKSCYNRAQRELLCHGCNKWCDLHFAFGSYQPCNKLMVGYAHKLLLFRAGCQVKEYLTREIALVLKGKDASAHPPLNLHNLPLYNKHSHNNGTYK